jgi:hypothetical protein
MPIRPLIALAFAVFAASRLLAGPVEFLRERGMAPVSYVSARLETHRVVILGEAHWTRHDVELMSALIPELRRKEAVLALEMFSASNQELLDEIVSADRWDEARAMKVVRDAAWPYREYLDIVHAAWEANRAPGPPIRILALGPGLDWRETLPKGVTYDSFMAAQVMDALRGGAKRVVVYAGLHHAFTHYHQPELDLSGRARGFMDRAGNILRRELGVRVFMIALHKPLWCGEEPWSYCLPLDGAIDCAAATLGRPVGFDLAGSPFGPMELGPSSYYAHGYPSLRMIDFADGWIWFAPVESYELVELIPLTEFAPDAEALEYVLAHSPFANDKQSLEELEKSWERESERRRSPLESRGWWTVAGWRELCAQD